MKAFLLVTVLICACCGATPAPGQAAPQPASAQEQPVPAQQPEQGGYVVMTELDYQRLVRMVQLLTHALEQQNAEVVRMADKLKETCP